MLLRLPPLSSLRQFEAAARHESFSKAARELGQTASAVSHAIDALEKHLGIILFKREGRGVSLTAAGQTFIAYVRDGLTMIASGVGRLPGGPSDRHVTLSVVPTFAQRFLVPRISGFRRQHPGIRLSIDTSHRLITFPHDAADLSIRFGRGVWPSAKSELLFRESLIPVVSPSYLATITKAGVSNWSFATFICVSFLEHDWGAWRRAVGVELHTGDELHVDTALLAYEAAVVGMGIALGRLPMILPELESGALVVAMQPAVDVEAGYWLVGPEDRETRPAVDVFRHWLLQEIESYCEAIRHPVARLHASISKHSEMELVRRLK